MTNAELLAKIKTEIESLKSIEYPCDNSQQATGFFNALDRMTDFLSTLESEKPVPNDLEEAAESHAKTKYGLTRLLGAEMKEVEDDFIAGAKWDRSQMMKEVVEGDYDCQYMTPAVFLDKYLDGIKDGDKVRIIIVKEDEK